jgi:hypothetical protein
MIAEVCNYRHLPHVNSRSINYIVLPSVTEELICSTLAMLDSLSCVPVNNGLLGMHIASPGILFTFIL